MIDNVESDSTPVIYTRRSRFLDEELDESKDIITTHRYPLVNQTECTDDRTYHKISMLMSDGVVNTTNANDPNDTKSMEQCKLNYLNCDTAQDINPIDMTKSSPNFSTECNQIDENDAEMNQNYSTHTKSESIAINKSGINNKTEIFGYLASMPHENCDKLRIDCYSQSMIERNRSTEICELKSTIQNADMDVIDSNPNDNKQLLNMHQLRLSRVAEWVQNNSNHETCLNNPTANNVQQINSNVSSIFFLKNIFARKRNVPENRK